MPIHYAKLTGRIIERYGSKQEFAKAMGLSMATVSMKINKKRSWTQAEMEKACNLLGIPLRQVSSYFFEI